MRHVVSRWIVSLKSRVSRIPRRRRSPEFAFLLVCIFLTACGATKSFYTSENVRPEKSVVRVVLMPPDIELYELTAGGLLEPEAGWTFQAKQHVTAALREELKERKAHLVLFQSPTDQPSKYYAYNQIVKLHEAVGGAILVHKYNEQFKLPTKEDKFDWSLGRGVNVLAREHDAQYGLFIYLRDSYASADRVTYMVLASILSFGRYIPHGGVQVGFASLVDLQSGEIVWFNRLARATGDLRTPEPAHEAVEELLTDLPL